MAAVWGAEGEVEGAATRRVAAATEWKPAEVFLTVSGFRIALRLAVAVERLKVEVTPLPLTDHKFEDEFDEEALRRAGFGLLMPFLDRFQVIRGALKGDELVTATLTVNGSDADLHITVAVAYFLAKYKLSLRKVPVLLSDKLSMDVIAFKQQLADVQLELEQTKAELREAVSDGYSKQKLRATTQELDTATQRVAEVLKETTALKSQLAKEKAKAATERRSTEQTLADLRATTEKQLSAAKTELKSQTDALSAEIRARDKRIVELESGLKPVDASSTEHTAFSGDSVVLTRGTFSDSGGWNHYGSPDALKLTNDGVDFYLRGVGIFLCDGITIAKVQIKMGGKVVSESKLKKITGEKSKKPVELKLKKAFLFKKGHVIDVVVTQITHSSCCFTHECSTELTAMGGIKVKVSDSSESENCTSVCSGALPCFYIG